MKQNTIFSILFLNIMIIFFFIVLLYTSFATYAPIPMGPIDFVQNTNYTFSPTPVTSLNASGGNYTYIILNTTSQTFRWNAFVGNITGFLGLGDQNNRSLYKWTINRAKGEIYATRQSTIVDWVNIQCANSTNINNEENDLSINNTDVDSINRTFFQRDHKSFIASAVYFEQNECLAIKTFSNIGDQDSYFEEVLLYGGQKILYAVLLENDIVGFNGKTYDFQMILPNTAMNGSNSRTSYQFYTELV